MYFAKPSPAIARQFYKHVACGTERPTSVVAGVHDGLRDPKSRDQGYCVTCQKWFPLGEFVWRGEGEGGQNLDGAMPR